MMNSGYNQNSGGRYDKGGERNTSFLLKTYLWIIALALVVLAIFYYEPIVNKVLEWTKANDKDIIVDVVSDENVSETLVADTTNYIPEIPTDNTSEPGIIPEDVKPAEAVKPVDREPKFSSTPIEKNPRKSEVTKPVENEVKQTSIIDYSKHKLELFVDQKTNKYGLKDLTINKVLIEPKYDVIKSLPYNRKMPYAIAVLDNNYGIVNMEGKVVLPFEYSYINEQHYIIKEGITLFRITKKDADGYSRDGLFEYPESKILIPAEYYYLSRTDGSYTFFKAKKENNDDCYGVLSRQGKVIVPFEYNYIQELGAAGYVKLSKPFYKNPTDSRPSHYIYGIMRLKDAKLILPLEYEEIELIGSISFIRVKQNGLYGCVNEKNEIIVPLQKVTSMGSSQSPGRPETNIIRFSLPDGTTVCYNVKGQKVPCN